MNITKYQNQYIFCEGPPDKIPYNIIREDTASLAHRHYISGTSPGVSQNLYYNIIYLSIIE